MASRQQRTHKLEEASRVFSQDQDGACIILVLFVYQHQSTVRSVVKVLDPQRNPKQVNETGGILCSQILIKADLGKGLSGSASLQQFWQIGDYIFQISRKYGLIVFLYNLALNLIMIIQFMLKALCQVSREYEKATFFAFKSL